MCGINGCLHLKEFSYSLEEFSKATSILTRRGPDSSGISEDILDRFVLKMGHQRLSIIGIDETGNQPMTSLNDLFSIVYNGEIYNHLELRNKLNSRSNIQWKGACDTETLINLLEYDSLDNVLDQLEGMFAFCIFDRTQQRITFVRDRSGEKPLYLSTGNKFLGFSSDLSSLKQTPDFSNSLNNIAIEKYLQHNYIPSPWTVYDHSFKLPAGSYLTIDLKEFIPKAFSTFDELINAKGVIFKKWWSLSNAYNLKNANLSFSDDEVVDQTEELLEESVTNQLISDVPLGAFLSGGIDSSLIVAMMRKNNKITKTFTVGFNFLDYDESIYAEKIAKYLGSEHTTYVCGKQDVLDIIPQLPISFSEPFADSSQIPTMLVSKLARQEVKVALSGDAGDELFGGYNRYLLAYKYWRYIKHLSPGMKKSLIFIAEKFPKKFLSILFSLTPLSSDLSGSLEVRLEKVLNKLKVIKDPASFYQSMVTEWTRESNIVNFKDKEAFHHQDLFSKSSRLTFEEAMMHTDFETYLPDDILCKVDRSSMFSSLETRAPFLSKKLIEFSYSLPLKYKIRNGQTKWVLREVLRKYIPEDLYERPKQGFGIPISIWMRSDLKDWVNDLLSEEVCNKHGLFNFNEVKKLKDDHFSGSFNHEHKLWSILQFNQWHQENMS